MKILNLIVVIVTLVMMIQGCKDNNVNSPVHDFPTQAAAIESDDLPFQFSFTPEQINQLNNDLELVSKAITYLCSDSILKLTILNAAALLENDEVVYLWYLEIQLTSLNINLLASMQAALLEHGYDSADVNRMAEFYKTFNMNNSSYSTLIHIPFTESINYNATPLVTYQIQPIEQLSDLNVFTLSSTGEIEVATVSEELATKQPALFISIESVDGVQYAALPWHNCECSRDSQSEPGWVSSSGVCVSRGDCSKCGRASFKGKCSGARCAGC